MALPSDRECSILHATWPGPADSLHLGALGDEVRAAAIPTDCGRGVSFPRGESDQLQECGWHHHVMAAYSPAPAARPTQRVPLAPASFTIPPRLFHLLEDFRDEKVVTDPATRGIGLLPSRLGQAIHSFQGPEDIHVGNAFTFVVVT